MGSNNVNLYATYSFRIAFFTQFEFRFDLFLKSRVSFLKVMCHNKQWCDFEGFVSTQWISIYLYIFFTSWTDVQSIFGTNDIVWSWIVFLLLVLIGALIWRLRRAQASNRLATAKKATIKDTVQSVFPLEQHASEPGSYMELRPRPSEGQTRLPPEYQSLQGSHVNAGYYNVVPKEGNKRGSNEEIYEEIELSNC